MIDYIYDGSFEGLLTTIFYTFSEKDTFTICKNSLYQENLFNNKKAINIEEDKFIRVYNSINSKLSPSTLKKIYYVYLSETINNELLIYKYLKLCFKYSNSINLAKNNDIIIEIDRIYRAVSKEAHMFTGFVRFREIAPLTFYAEIEPSYNILPIIMDHFTNRFSDQNFIIHDLKRESAIIYNKSESFISNLSLSEGLLLKEKTVNDTFENLFQSFYKALNIEERKNESLRRYHMPKRYWKHLIELDTT